MSRSGGLMLVRSGNYELAELQCCIAIGEIGHAAATNFNQKMYPAKSTIGSCLNAPTRQVNALQFVATWDSHDR